MTDGTRKDARTHGERVRAAENRVQQSATGVITIARAKNGGRRPSFFFAQVGACRRRRTHRQTHEDADPRKKCRSGHYKSTGSDGPYASKSSAESLSTR